MNTNIAALLPQQAQALGEQAAVVAGMPGTPSEQRISFATLEHRSDALAWGLSAYGITQGTRVLLMVPAGVPLIALTFALFKIGAVPILIDPAMGRQNLAVCIQECQPEALIGIPRAHLARLIFRQAFRTTRTLVTVGRRLGWGGATLDELETIGATVQSAFPLAIAAANEVAAITFTTGSTGVPKGVVYEHGMFQAQAALLRDFYQIAPGEVEMPAFPLFALFNVALGVTSAIPPIDPTRPASCDPAAVTDFVQAWHITSTFGSPAIWERVTAYCIEHGVKLPSLRRVLMAGAPVPIQLHQRFEQILGAEANTYTPYGATEALPIASISGRNVLTAHAERADPIAGTCIGWPVPHVDARIIAINDAPIANWSDVQILETGHIGEITVRGPMVTKTYINRPESTKQAKIADGEQIWHRMGDLGYLDEQGRIWFYGRKTDRVETGHGTLFTEPVELVFNQHPLVFRSALVGVAGEPIVVIEPRPDHMPTNIADHQRFVDELHTLGAAHTMTAGISRFLFHPSFPVDIRHNAKIFREKLAVWAANVGTPS